MADVRSLLRNELATRKGTSQPNTAGNRISKKRKVDSGDGHMRKKLRSTTLDAVHSASSTPNPQPSSAQEEDSEEEADVASREPPIDEDEEMTGPLPLAGPQQTTPLTTAEPAQQQTSSAAVDEDEWAAFEREVAAPTRMALAAISAEATISAAPVTAEELAAQQDRGHEMSATRTREAELEGEREDAARMLEEEFDQMEELEERVKSMKHKREELRQKLVDDRNRIPQQQDQDMVSAESDSDSDEDVDEDWDDWRFK
ncbi:hypothetical protein N7510_006211 [Penicillium lagena]|uniref:uncharacterized protein n=1 Tax=Penicillium lagena TaxID=94218 RepID=UPI00253F66F8|nr:uncharacterized protein N7510_006211 [Penicillium lagena]KAJ5613017.1 hypothetical protein N7510_006211 [Penicillium lagena]